MTIRVVKRLPSPSKIHPNAIFGGTQISQGSGIPEVPCNNMSDDLTRPTASDSNIANKKKKPKMFKMFKKLKKS